MFSVNGGQRFVPTVLGVERRDATGELGLFQIQY
jgi:hypothetical protein